MDIDDILASVSHADTPSSSLADFHALVRAWTAERTAPELLPYPSALLSRITTRIATQIARVEDLTSALDPAANFTLVVLQTELERAKYLLRALLRTRLAKMDAFPRYYLGLAEGQDGGAENPLLSGAEREYLRHHATLLEGHYKASFLGAFPGALQRMDDPTGMSMIDKPDEESAVFVRVLRDAGVVEVQGEQGAGELDLHRGDVWVLRWDSVKDRVLRGDVELI